MNAIVTRFLSPTNTRGARIVATANGARKVYSFDHPLGDGEGPFRKAAEALRDMLDWPGELIGGYVDGGYVFTFAPRRPRYIVQRIWTHHDTNGNARQVFAFYDPSDGDALMVADGYSDLRGVLTGQVPALTRADIAQLPDVEATPGEWQEWRKLGALLARKRQTA